MQVIKAEVIPIELSLRHPVRMAGVPEIAKITAIFVHFITRGGQSAWGCTVGDPTAANHDPELILKACRDCAAMVPDLNPLNLEYSLAELAPLAEKAPTALCAFDLAYHDLLSLSTGIPLYRLLGGYRNRILTSITIPLANVEESVQIACEKAADGFRIFKVKGGLDPDQDVQRVKAIRRAFPQHALRLDADGGYNEQQALDVARALKGQIEMFEQPTPASDLTGLRQVSKLSPVPVLADQSASDPGSALQIAAGRCAQGISVKLASCGGLSCARQIDSIARAARLFTMVSCLIEPALLIAAGLSFALASSNVRFGDLDGYMDLVNDPSQAGFILEDGWMIATDVPGLGYSVNLG